MNKQEIFDKVCAHLMTQYSRCTSYNARGNAICSYRGKTDDLSGRDGKCAIGCLIPDEKYRRIMEGAGIEMNGWVKDVLRTEGIDVDDKDTLYLLENLQKVHDKQVPQNWEWALEDVATRFELVMPEWKIAQTFPLAGGLRNHPR